MKGKFDKLTKSELIAMLERVDNMLSTLVDETSTKATEYSLRSCGVESVDDLNYRFSYSYQVGYFEGSIKILVGELNVNTKNK